MKNFLFGTIAGLLLFYILLNGVLFYTTSKIEGCAAPLYEGKPIEEVKQCFDKIMNIEQKFNYILLYPIHKIKGR